jgi:hypothetical protein
MDTFLHRKDRILDNLLKTQDRIRIYSIYSPTDRTA